MEDETQTLSEEIDLDMTQLSGSESVRKNNSKRAKVDQVLEDGETTQSSEEDKDKDLLPSVSQQNKPRPVAVLRRHVRSQKKKSEFVVIFWLFLNNLINKR
jgi:hypothetical protein